MIEPANHGTHTLVADFCVQEHGCQQDRSGSGAMQIRAVILAAALVLAPIAARAADLVIWWEEGYNPEEDSTVREIVTAFEQKTGKQVELAFYTIDELPGRALAAVEAGHPPDLMYGIDVAHRHYLRWAYERRLADLTDALRSALGQFGRDALADTTFLDATTGRCGLHALPMGRITNHVHVWKSLLEQAGFTLADIPKEWEPFWLFWCDQVQPAIRKATGRDDLYGVDLPMSVLPAGDTMVDFLQFVVAYEADYVTHDGRLVIDEPTVRMDLVRALNSYTILYRKGCVPPDAAEWNNYSNNKAFLSNVC
jgi:multiple sugar transport system substrate-binding protein